MIEKVAFVIGVIFKLASLVATAWGFVEYEAAFPGPVAAVLIARTFIL